MQVKWEQRVSPHPVSSSPAAGRPGLPAGTAAAQVHQCGIEKRRWLPVGGDRTYEWTSHIGPLSQHTWIVLALQNGRVVVMCACLSLLDFIWHFLSLLWGHLEYHCCHIIVRVSHILWIQIRNAEFDRRGGSVEVSLAPIYQRLYSRFIGSLIPGWAICCMSPPLFGCLY